MWKNRLQEPRAVLGAQAAPTPQWSLTPPQCPAVTLVTDTVPWHHPPYKEPCGPTTPPPPNIGYTSISPLSLLLIRKQRVREMALSLPKFTLKM